MVANCASLTLSESNGQIGLLLWTVNDADIPRIIRSPFRRGKWRTDVPMYGCASDGGVSLGRTDGWWLSASQAVEAFAPLPLKAVDTMPPSLAVWTLASKWVIEALSLQLIVPGLVPGDVEGNYRSTWHAAPVRPEDRTRLAGLASAMPGVARACPFGRGNSVLTSAASLRQFLDAAVDGLLRASTRETSPHPSDGPGWVVRLGHSLAGPDAEFAFQGLADRHLPATLERWAAQATSMGRGGHPLVGFRLEEPRSKQGEGTWRITYHLLDPTAQNRISIKDLVARKPSAREVAAKMTKPMEALFDALGRSTRVFPPIARSLTERFPDGVKLDASEAWHFLTRAALKLQRAGYWVDVPAALSRVGRRRVRARMRVGTEPQERMGSGLFRGMTNYVWEASLGEDTLTAEEFRKLADSKSPLILHRGQWVAVDPAEIERLKDLMEAGGGELDLAEALRLSLAGEVSVPGCPDTTADVVCENAIASLLKRLRDGVSKETAECEPSPSLQGTLRPYQKRGLGWLRSVTSTGFGACLADDMGLGKTIQVLSFALELAESGRGRKTLVVCPTSVLGNWRREIQRFTPSLTSVIHHGPNRASGVRALQRQMRQALDAGAPGVVLITSYALARRDVEFFRKVNFDTLVLDEAQNIKNAEAAQSRAVRRLRSRRRIALTGTPVENRLSELWSIMDFLTPALLGSQTSFKKGFAIPIERYGDEEVAERLRRVTAPFILRRLKTEPTIAPDLPEKIETVRYCPLTREQAALYQAVLDEGMTEISILSPGMERRGRILSMLTALKQICNHPCNYLRDGRINASRSGKLTRFLELTQEVFAVGGHPLVFTQYREMGEILQATLERRLQSSIPFFHGGLSCVARERMVKSFQSSHGPAAMIVSLKAGGTGLNLTRANHVFHFDRWWNPAVEDQATDRAFRIGQDRDVTVHRLVSQGTLEEQIDEILKKKRLLADRVIGQGETWLSELDDSTLHDLVRLGQDAVLEEDV